MDDLSEAMEDGVVGPVAVEDGLEGDVVTVVGEFDSDQVETGDVGGEVVGVVEEHELGFRVHESSDEPGGRGTVDMHPGSGAPPHRLTARSTLAARLAKARWAMFRSGGGKWSRRSMRRNSERSPRQLLCLSVVSASRTASARALR